jgi:site-specific DNA-cytosine methylase
MLLSDFIRKPSRAQSKPQAKPQRDTKPAPQTVRQQVYTEIDDLARQAARSKDGRPSDAVRAYIKQNPGAGMRRGELLARARAVMLEVPSRAAVVPSTPLRVTKRDPNRWGYPNHGKQAFLDAPLLGMEAFSGGGLFSLASALEGNIEVADCEWNKWAVATRARNAKLLRLAFKPETNDARLWRPPLDTPDGLDLLFGGPPCSPFSKGADLGRSGRDRGWLADDNFFPVALDWICDLQPRVVVWENAPTLMERPEYREWLDAWRAQARAIGYESAAHVLDAADFGNPTQRRRTMVFLWPKGAPWGDALRAKPEGHFARPGSPEVKRGEKMPWVPMLDRLTGGCCGGWGLVDCVFLGGWETQCRGCMDARNFAPAPNTDGDHGRRGVKGITIDSDRGRMPWHRWIKQNVGEAQPRFDKFVPGDMAGVWTPIKRQARDLVIEAGRRVSEYLSRTVVPGFGNKAEGLLIPPDVKPEDYRRSRDWGQAQLEELERMSVRDAAKLQDVPQWYGFEGSRAEAFKQIGMGVPVNLGRGVMAHVRRAMGLPLRAPWWETRVPVKPRDIRFESREQIARTPTGQLKGGAGSGQPDGLWPTDAFDMCYAVPPILEVGGLLPSSFIEDDWDTYVTMGEIGTQAQRAAGNSKLDRLIDRLPPRIQAAARKQRGGRVKSLFTDEGLNTDALWRTGYRGPVDMPPEDMPGQDEFNADPEAWADALRYGGPMEGGEWTTLLGLYLRLSDPETMYAQDGWEEWWGLWPLGPTLPTITDEIAAEFRAAGLPVPDARLLEKVRRADEAASSGGDPTATLRGAQNRRR